MLKSTIIILTCMSVVQGMPLVGQILKSESDKAAAEADRSWKTSERKANAASVTAENQATRAGNRAAAVLKHSNDTALLDRGNDHANTQRRETQAYLSAEAALADTRVAARDERIAGYKLNLLRQTGDQDVNLARLNNTHSAQMQRQLVESQVACETRQDLRQQRECQHQLRIAQADEQRQRTLMNQQHDLDMRKLDRMERITQGAGAGQLGYTNATRSLRFGGFEGFEGAGLPLANYAASDAGATPETRLTIPLRPTMRVMLKGLTGARYNGQLGTLESRNGNGRWTVRLDGNDNNQLAVQPQNLTALQNVRVRIHGLKSGSYNGRAGTIQNYNGERWLIKLDGADGKIISVRDQNLTVLS